MNQQATVTNLIAVQEVCKHEFVTEARGQVRFVAGEVDDTLEVHTVCRMCGYEPADLDELEDNFVIAI